MCRKAEKITDACHNMAKLIAYAQIRSSGRKGSTSVDELIEFAKQAQNWKSKLLDYAYNYYQQVLQDYTSFCKAYAAHQPTNPQVKK